MVAGPNGPIAVKTPVVADAEPAVAEADEPILADEPAVLDEPVAAQPAFVESDAAPLVEEV